MAERGLAVDHVTIWRWGQHYAPLLNQRLRRELRHRNEWQLNVNEVSGAVNRVTLDEIKALPKIEQTTELNCIEGWSDIIHWTGARFSDFCAKFAPDAMHTAYVSLETPGQEYYVGIDMASALHSQTLLCYEMNRAPLSLENGAPLRLVMPTKYGIKNIKRIGTIAYTDQRPPDY